jgi:hypothetical protein
MQILSILALMERRRQSILALLLVAAMPTTSIVFALQWSDSEFLTQAFFIFAKLWIIAISLYWLYRVDNSKFSLQRTREGERSGLIIGSGMFFIILATYTILGDSIDTEKMRAEIGSTGLLDRNTFLIGVVYWVIFNSLVDWQSILEHHRFSRDIHASPHSRSQFLFRLVADSSRHDRNPRRWWNLVVVVSQILFTLSLLDLPRYR